MRHSLINNIVCHALSRVDVSAVREPSGLLIENGKHPDGATLVPLTRGKYLSRDATIPNTLAASHLQSMRSEIDAATAHATALTL
jgi:hypothetical protein